MPLVTQGSQASSSFPKSTKPSLILETVALLMVGTFLLALIFALTAVLEGGFE